MRSRILVAVQGTVTVVLLGLLSRQLDWRAFGALFHRLSLTFYAGSLAAVLVGQVCYAWRWHILLTATGRPVPFRAVLQQYFVGIFVSNFLPSTVGGDVMKVYYLGRAHGYRRLTASVMLDRVLGIGLLAALAAACAWLAPVSSPRFVVARSGVTAIALGAFTLLAVSVTGTGGLSDRLGARGGWLARAGVSLREVRLFVGAPLRDPGVWLKAIAVVGSYALTIAALYVSFIATQTGLHLPLVPVLIASASTLVLSNIPVTVNGLGLREQLHAYLLAPLGVPTEVAVGLSLLFFAHLAVASVIGGVLWARTRRAVAPHDADALASS